MTEMFTILFPVNNLTQLDAMLDHSLNTAWSHQEVGVCLVSTRSSDWLAQRQTSLQLTLAQAEADSQGSGGAVGGC